MTQDARHWTVYRCPSCEERIYLVSAGTFGCETWMVDVEPSESGYVLVTNDSFGALDRPVGEICGNSRILEVLAADEHATFRRLHLHLEEEVAA